MGPNSQNQTASQSARPIVMLRDLGALLAAGAFAPNSLTSVNPSMRLPSGPGPCRQQPVYQQERRMVNRPGILRTTGAKAF